MLRSRRNLRAPKGWKSALASRSVSFESNFDFRTWLETQQRKRANKVRLASNFRLGLENHLESPIGPHLASVCHLDSRFHAVCSSFPAGLVDRGLRASNASRGIRLLEWDTPTQWDRSRNGPAIGDTFEQSRSAMPESSPATRSAEGWKRALACYRQPRILRSRSANTDRLAVTDPQRSF
jgi:hypothetical protein